MAKKVLSVFFTNDEVRVCELQKKGTNVIVSKAFSGPVAEGVVDDGTILDVDGAAKALYAVFKSNKIKREKIAFVIASRKIANKEIVIPYVKNQSKIDEMIKANIDEYFPMNNLEDYVYKYNLLDVTESEDGKQFSVLVMAVQKEMIQSYYDVAAKLKLSIETVDYYGNAIYQLLKRQLGHEATTLNLQMDSVQTVVSIMRGTSQQFKRSIPFGSDSIIRNLAELKEIDLEEAESLLSDPRRMDLLVSEEEFSDLIREFIGSVSRVVEFHITRNPGTVIDRVNLMGSGVEIPGFMQALAEDLGIEVSAIVELNGIKTVGKKKQRLTCEELIPYLANIGALINPLNLKPQEEKKKSGSEYTIFIVLLVFATLSVCGSMGFLFWQMNSLEQEKRELQKQINQYGTAEATYNEYLTAQQNYSVLQSYYEMTENPSELLYQMILDLEEVMPESVGIVDLSVKDGSVEITGVADGKDSLAKFVIELKKLPYVQSVRVEDILDTTTELGGKTSTFNMKWQLVWPEETEAEATENTTENSTEGGAQ